MMFGVEFVDRIESEIFDRVRKKPENKTRGDVQRATRLEMKGLADWLVKKYFEEREDND